MADQDESIIGDKQDTFSKRIEDADWSDSVGQINKYSGYAYQTFPFNTTLLPGLIALKLVFGKFTAKTPGRLLVDTCQIPMYWPASIEMIVVRFNFSFIVGILMYPYFFWCLLYSFGRVRGQRG